MFAIMYSYLVDRLPFIVNPNQFYDLVDFERQIKIINYYYTYTGGWCVSLSCVQLIIAFSSIPLTMSQTKEKASRKCIVSIQYALYHCHRIDRQFQHYILSNSMYEIFQPHETRKRFFLFHRF